MVFRKSVLFVLLFPVACTTGNPILDEFEPVPATPIVEAPMPAPGNVADMKVINQGKYMVELLGCGGCHTDGALIGTPDLSRALSGSHIGIAHSNPLQVEFPGVVFPSNLTPDPETGIGRRSDSQLSATIRGRVGRHDLRNLRVMPVAAFASVKDDDINAIIAYLRSLPAVRNQVPREVVEGTKTDELFVHFGVYRNREK